MYYKGTNQTSPGSQSPPNLQFQRGNSGFNSGNGQNFMMQPGFAAPSFPGGQSTANFMPTGNGRQSPQQYSYTGYQP